MTPQQPVEFRFARAWIHAGVEYQPGDRVHFAPATARMLVELDAGDLVKLGKQARRAETHAADHNTTGEQP
ncbi:MAG: hypothetical protein L0H70_05620 [Xanthomonadales bacterium]|nr:hypothetical protein [Xanthomonadales bacterium]